MHMTEKAVMELLVVAFEAFDRRREESGDPTLFQHEERIMVDRQLRRVETATRVACGDRRLP